MDHFTPAVLVRRPAQTAVRCCLAGLALLVAQTAAAQPPPPDRSRLAVEASAGMTRPWHGDLDFSALTWQAGVELPVSPRTGFLVDVSGWRHQDTDVTLDVPIQGPNGVIGHIDRLTRTTTHQVNGLGVSWVAKAGGRVVVRAGGGPGVYVHRRVVDRDVEGCAAPDPATCAASTTTRTSFAAGVQGLADLAFNGQGRVQPFVQARVAVTDLRDVASGQFSALAGLRLVGW